MEAGLGPGLTETAVEGSHVPRSVWLALVAVCGGWMTGRLVMGMLPRVGTQSCCVAASVVAVRVGGSGGRDVMGVGPWLRGRFCCCCCRPFCDCWGCVLWC